MMPCESGFCTVVSVTDIELLVLGVAVEGNGVVCMASLKLLVLVLGIPLSVAVMILPLTVGVNI